MLEGIRRQPLDEVSQIVGDAELLELLRRRLSGGGGGSGGGGVDDVGEVRRNDLGDGEGLDLIGLLEGGCFDLVGFLGGLGGELAGAFGGLGD